MSIDQLGDNKHTSKLSPSFECAKFSCGAISPFPNIQSYPSILISIILQSYYAIQTISTLLPTIPISNASRTDHQGFLGLGYYIQMYNRSHKKQGHRRQISKELIKRQLMQQLYPIPRQHKIISRSKAKTQIDHKFTKTLEFLEYNQTETILLQRFQEKVESELTLSQAAMQMIFSQLAVDKRVPDLSTKLVNDKNCTDNVKFELKGLVSTAKKEIKQIILLLFFFSFMKNNKTEYRSLLRQFQERKIAEILASLKYEHGVILTSKITSVLCMVYIKYQQKAKFIHLAQKAVKLRDKYQQQYGLIKGFNINCQYASTTFFFSLKSLQYQLKSDYDSYELMLQIQKVISKMHDYPQTGLIQNSVRQIFFNQIKKIKAMVSAKVEQDYYRSLMPAPQQSKQNKTKQAIKLYKRRRSLTNLKHTSFSSQDQNVTQFKKIIAQFNQNQKATVQRKKEVKNARQIYVAEKAIKKNISVFQKPQLSSKLKKSSKLPKHMFSSTKGFLQGQRQLKETLKASQGLDANLIRNYGCLFMKDNDETSEVQQKKKNKISQIYQTFAKENNIIRDIPSKNVERELKEICGVKLGNKAIVKQMFKKVIIEFTAGLQDNSQQFNKILSLKKCLSLQFIKIWIGELYNCKIDLQVTGTECSVSATLNNHHYRLLLHRGENVLCERYLTIWPTVRYLISKKIATISVFSLYQKDLMAKKMGENQITHLCNTFYEQKFGIISKQQIEEINICLDNVVKLIMIIAHYYQKKDVKIQFNKQYKYRIASNKVRDGETLKLNLITQICLNQMSKIHLFSFILSSKYGSFIIDGFSPRDKLLISINNKSGLQIKMTFTDLIKKKYENSDSFVIGWQELESIGISFESFLKFVRSKCAHMKINKYFLNNLLHFIAKRLYVTYHPILKTEVIYKNTPNIQYLSNYRSKKHREKEAQYSTHNSQSILKVVQNDDYVDACLRQQVQKFVTFTIQRCEINKSCQPRKKIAKNVQRLKEKAQFVEKIWQQQRIIKGRYFLIRIMLKKMNEIEFEAEYILIDRKTQHKYIFMLNNLDLKQLINEDNVLKTYKPQIFLSSKNLKSHVQDDLLNNTHFRKAQLIELLDNFDFYYNHHVKKIFINCQKSNYCHSFKERYRKSFNEIKLRGKFLGEIQKQPFLSKSVLNCKFRMTKILKIGQKYAFLSFKRILIHEQFFWQVILDFQRKHTQMVSQIQEKKVMQWLSDYRRVNKNPYKSHTSSRFCQESLSQKKIKENYLQAQNSPFNIHLNYRHEDSIDYKKKILRLFDLGQIQVITENGFYQLFIRHQQFNFRQRIIQEYDNEKHRIYFVWFDGQWLQVQMLLNQPIDSSAKSQRGEQRTVLKDFASQSLGKIEFFNAKRFYQMQNKDLDEGDDYEKRICLFYFEWCKHQRIKYQSQANQIFS